MKRIALLLTPLIALVALLYLFATNIDRDPNFIPSALLNKPVPEFSLPAVPGLSVPGFDSASLKGQVSVVNVFGSWCVPCRDEHPLLMELAASGEVKIFGLNQKDTPENAGAFLAELGNPYDFVGADTKGRTSIDWGVYGVPETFVVNADGIITYKHTGPLSRKSLETSLKPAILAARQ